MQAAIVIPTYNESDNIETLVSQVLALPGDLRVLIVDDNSPDGTGRIADDLATRSDRVQALHRPAKLGLGSAYITGFKAALALGMERIMTMDADFSHHPRYIPALIAQTHTCDLSIGSRYVDGGGTLHCGLRRQVLSHTANLAARLVLGLSAHDCTAGFRCYRRQVLESIDLDQIFSNGYSFLIEMLYKCQQRGYRVGEVPIIFEDRRRGLSKISRQEIIKAIYTVLRLGWERAGKRPLPWPERGKESIYWKP